MNEGRGVMRTVPCSSIRAIVAFAALLSFISPISAQTIDREANAPLLENLGDSLLDDLPIDRPPARASAQSEGDDLGAGQGGLGPGDWLRPVTKRMRQAEAALKTPDATDRASVAQEQAVSELDAMIERLRQQCQKCGGQCNKPPVPQKKPPKPSAKAGAKPGQSTAQLTGEVVRPDQTAIAKLVKDLWGQLPQRQREELLQPLSEEFLPEYAADIEDYFHDLATPADGRLR